MKKNDGYVMVFVMVVLLVLCITATSLMSVSLRNLQRQESAVEQMIEYYRGEG